jgi:hypothetical protein
MTSDVMKQALAATARVACLASLTACGPTLQADVKDLVTQLPEDDDAVQPADTDSVDTDDVDTDTGDAVVTLDTTDVGECLVHTTESFANGDPVTSDTEACCQTLAQAVDGGDDSFQQEWDLDTLRYDCCTVLDWNGSLACTPWGPPAPPKMVA